ncbi:hypothetical protein VW35_05045 [Devosia soli]|uniref:Activator of Hsp90 ATPase homologue 1/2-like C-terminal domain-containing protein n=1 Tax=Devosia soli TaxID=361041 RepID=A0A0F5LCD8_9HYPH|nr:SRPBCC domain-containing protein [Devosia soli]KKB79859.1 hypothetical protein VW35_05045 [Devosia soli]
MTDNTGTLVFETTLDAPPEKVWRALSIPEYLDRWLQRPENAEISVVSSDENRRLTYRWRENGQTSEPEESLVTFEIAPREDGGTWFRLTHAPLTMPVPANSNEPAMMLAA